MEDQYIRRIPLQDLMHQEYTEGPVAAPLDDANNAWPLLFLTLANFNKLRSAIYRNRQEPIDAPDLMLMCCLMIGICSTSHRYLSRDFSTM